MGPDAPWLAPLAGFSDLPFRLLCRENGAAVACTEMVSAKGLLVDFKKDEVVRGKSFPPAGSGAAPRPPEAYKIKVDLLQDAAGAELHGASAELLRTVPEDAPLVVQLFGAEPDCVAAAAREAMGRGFLFFDVNMGCSVPKVMKTGAGAALLRDPDKAAAVGRALFRAAGEGRAGCKLRLGPDAASPVYADLARRLEDEGAAWLTLHPRHARQGFAGSADCAALEKLARSVNIPVLASGDLFNAEEAVKRLETGVRGVMFARGALADPGIFRRYLDLRAGRSPQAYTGAVGAAFLLRHARLARELSAERAGRSGIPASLLKMRGTAPRYLRAFPGVGRFRAALARCAGWDELYALAREFFPDAV
ncbi:MAG: tRNA-dihydrouridine synthase family protein [Desulfovibrio sp.]|nr:tRNA-dihydrouridine synthase family protein [Desulfovibrio sp.]